MIPYGIPYGIGKSIQLIKITIIKKPRSIAGFFYWEAFNHLSQFMDVGIIISISGVFFTILKFADLGL